jgi:hypothetical protein
MTTVIDGTTGCLANDGTSGYAATGYMRGQTVIFIEYL